MKRLIEWLYDVADWLLDKCGLFEFDDDIDYQDEYIEEDYLWWVEWLRVAGCIGRNLEDLIGVDGIE